MSEGRRVFAIGDLHLSFTNGRATFPMEGLSPVWREHYCAIADDWRNRVTADDIVLLAGDLSWHRNAKDAREDLEWISSLPGKKVAVLGNHDTWWTPNSDEFIAQGITVLNGNHVVMDDLVVFGHTYWIDHSLGWPMEWRTERRCARPRTLQKMLDLARLYACRGQLVRAALGAMAAAHRAYARRVVCLTHFPITDGQHMNVIIAVLRALGVDTVIFGHVHGAHCPSLRGSIGGVEYALVSADCAGFRMSEV